MHQTLSLNMPARICCSSLNTQITMKTGASAEPCAHLQIFMRLSFGRISFLGVGHPNFLSDGSYMVLHSLKLTALSCLKRNFKKETSPPSIIFLVLLLMEEILPQLIGSLSCLFTRLYIYIYVYIYICQVVQDFFHQQYLSFSSPGILVMGSTLDSLDIR